jgi:hypothetical protein
MKESPVSEHIAALDPEIESDDIDIGNRRAYAVYTQNLVDTF